MGNKKKKKKEELKRNLKLRPHFVTKEGTIVKFREEDCSIDKLYRLSLLIDNPINRPYIYPATLRALKKQ